MKIYQKKKARRFAFDKISSEVENICDSLKEKYNSNEEVTREEILKHKEIKVNGAAEFARLKIQVDRLLDYTDVQFDNKELMIETVLQAVSRIERYKKLFEEKLHIDLEKYDLTDQKMKLATLTKIDIGKFSGSMERGIDYYTFKSKFLKAYSNHPKTLLVEWLTNNHLEGKAKDCVGSLDCLDDIWTRLQNNFGNTEQMLFYQFKKITRLGHMHKQKSYESKKHYLQSLINTMQDVYEIAKEHQLEGELHYGNQLQKVVVLLENYIQSNWYKIVAKEQLIKPDRWTRMIIFLNEYLNIVQVRASETCSAEGVDGASNNSSNNEKRSSRKEHISEKGSGTYHIVEQCKLCDERHPNSNIEFIQCKRFLQMSPKERSDLVRQKKCCLQCLNGKTKWNDSSHKCSSAWICANKYHDKYEKKLHFLLCEHHVSDDSNKQLYEDFKRNVLKAEWQKRLHSSVYVSFNQQSYTAKKENMS